MILKYRDKEGKWRYLANVSEVREDGFGDEWNGPGTHQLTVIQRFGRDDTSNCPVVYKKEAYLLNEEGETIEQIKKSEPDGYKDVLENMSKEEFAKLELNKIKTI